MSTPPPVDLEEFRSAMRAAGIEEIVEPMLELFATEAEKGMALIASAVAAGDLAATERAAHSLKSSAGNVRAKALADLLQELETAAGARDRPAAARLLDRVRAEHASVVRYLAEVRGTDG
jgi:HPt (histidine-containing phosphotransfer) domain-containing protein